MNQVVKLQPSRMPIAPQIANEFDITPTQWRVLVEQIFPAAKSIEAVTMALTYCRARNLDIFKKPVHIVPMWSSQAKAMVETVWPGIAEVRTTASRTGEYAGIDAVEFGPMEEREFYGEMWVDGRKSQGSKTVRFPEWASVVVYRIVKGQKCAYHAKIFWEETYATAGKGALPNEMWSKRTRGQLDKCAEAAALRKAFPEELGSVYTADEMEGRVIDDQTHGTGPVSVPVPPPEPTTAPLGGSPIASPSPAPKIEPSEEPDIPACLDRRAKTEPADEGPSHSDVLWEFDQQSQIASDDGELEEIRSEYESRLDGAEDELWNKFHDILNTARNRIGC